MFVSATYYAAASQHAASWPTVYGTVIDSHVSYGVQGQGSWIRYEYEVLAQRYQSSRVAFGGGRVRTFFSSKRTRFPEGRSVTVYYNPDDPQDAVLEVGFHLGALLQGLLGIALMVVAWLI